jgi:hypothetical protein
VLYVWDYEFFKLIGALELEDCGEPVALQVINGYSVIILSTSEGVIFFIHFVRKELKIAFQLVGRIDVNSKAEQIFTSQKFNFSFNGSLTTPHSGDQLLRFSQVVNLSINPMLQQQQ